MCSACGPAPARGQSKVAMASILRKLISTPKAPTPVAPYNQAVLADKTLYVSGVLGLDKDTMALVEGGISAETRKALESLGTILEAGESSYAKVVKTTILLKNIEDFDAVNEIYKEFFDKDFPARCAYQVAGLPLNAQIEIDAIAMTGDVKTVTGGVTGCSTCGPSTCTCK